jgi:hypothetical protein
MLASVGMREKLLYWGRSLLPGERDAGNMSEPLAPENGMTQESKEQTIGIAVWTQSCAPTPSHFQFLFQGHDLAH